MALLGYSAFSWADTGVKFLAGHYSMSQLLMIENSFACLVLLLASPLLGGTRGLLRRENLKVHGLRIGLNFAVSMLVTYSFRELPMTSAYTLFFTIPFFAAIWGIPLYRENVPLNRVLAILAGFAGVLVAVRPGTSGFDIHMLAPLAAASIIALMFLSSKSLKDPSSFMLAFIPLLGAGLLAAPMGLMDFKMPTLQHLGLFALTGTCSATGFTLVSLAFRAAPAAAAAPMMYIQMLWGILFGCLIFADLPDAWMLAGAGIIILSGIYLIETERRSVNSASRSGSLLPEK